MTYVSQASQRTDYLVPAYAPPPPVVTLGGAVPYPQGDGRFSTQVAGTAPQGSLDQFLAMMSNDAYAADNPLTEQALDAAGWDRLAANGDGTALVDGQGREIPIDPELLSTGNGFDAAIYQNAEGQYVVAYRGTDDWALANPGDADDNGLQGLGFETGQYSDAIALAQRAEQVFGEGNVVVTGHSLGGGLASAAALATGASGVTFNAAGLSDETLESLGFNPNAVRASVADSGQIRRYAVNGDPLTGAQQDIPALPVPLLGPLSPPNALGHELRVDAPAGLGLDLAALHGGGGDGASYVDALRQNTPYDPALQPTLPERAGASVDAGMDAFGDQAGALVSDTGAAVDGVLDTAGGVLRGSPVPAHWAAGTALDASGAVIRSTSEVVGATIDGISDLAGDGADALIAFGGNMGRDVFETAGEFRTNQLGSLAREGTDLLGDVRGTVADTADGIRAAVTEEFAQGDHVEATFDIAGDLLDATVDTAGDLLSSGAAIAGDSVQNLANAGGSLLRSLGDDVGLQQPMDAFAGFVEGFGKGASDIADVGVEVVDDVADSVGDAVETAADAVGDTAQAVSDGIDAGARWVGGKLNPGNWF